MNIAGTTSVEPDPAEEEPDETKDLNINELPIEILEAIFKQLDQESLLVARLTCSLWNEEIIKHGPLDIILDDRKHSKFAFVNRVKNPKSLQVRSLEGHNYTTLNRHSLAKLETLRFHPLMTFWWTNLPTSLQINLKFFDYYANNVTELIFYKPALGNFNLSEDSGISSQDSTSLFPNLTTLTLVHIASYKRWCDGLEIQNTSKNIEFLLQHIASTKIKKLTIQLNTFFIDINSCVGRLPYRFEAKVLPQFICRQPMLKELNLEIPPSNSTWIPSNPAKYPTRLRKINVTCTCTAGGRTLEDIISIVNGILPHFPHLLEYNQIFYNSLAEPEMSEFWKQMLGLQCDMEDVFFVCNGNFESADFATKVVRHNWSTLTALILMAKFIGTVDGELFKDNTVLLSLSIWNNVFRNIGPNPLIGANPEAAGDFLQEPCRIIGFKYLPTNLVSISLRNVVINEEEIKQFRNVCESLKIFALFYEYHYFCLEDLNGFENILKLLIRRRQLETLIIGYLTPNMHNILNIYKPWIMNWIIQIVNEEFTQL